MKRFIGLLVVLAMGISFISGCSSSSTNANWNPLNSGQEIKIAVLGSEEQFTQYQELFNGMDMAIKELTDAGSKISYEKLDDQGNYDQAVNTATDVASDSKYTLAISVQSAELVGAVAYAFNEGQKPLIIASQALSRTMSFGYAYVINFTLLAVEQGYAAGKAAIDANAKWIVAAHSDSQFDKEFINGFERATNGTNTRILDIRELTNSVDDIRRLEVTLSSLKPDAFLSANYNAANLINGINLSRSLLGASLPVFTNATILNGNTIAQNKASLKNIGGIASYPVSESQALDNFVSQYKAQYGTAATMSAVQGYDAIKLISEKIQGTTTALDFMNNVKSDEGYNGIASLKFDLYGRIVTDNAIAFYTDSNGNLSFKTIYF